MQSQELLKQAHLKVSLARTSVLQNSDAFEIVSSEVQDEQTVNYKLRKLTSISNSELLSLVGAQGEICKFTECIPSMNDIFIRTVEEKI
jgi:ABC-2 type transport system ATP-binding protein